MRTAHQPPRTLLFTGKGGVGKTTVAAATATVGALRGRRTLVLSTDSAHSLSDTFDAPVGPEPTEVDDRLWVQQVDPQRRFEESWSAVQGYLMRVLDSVGVDRIAAEELTVLPGAEEVFALLELRRQALSGDYDLVVVDCAPTAETLRLLALPEAMAWYMDRILPGQRRLMRMFKPVFTRTAGVPMPEDDVFDAVERLHAELSQVRALLTADTSAVRLVLTPESVVVAEARRCLTSLSLYGYRVDGVIANRIFPSGGDAWRQHWVTTQAGVMADVDASFAPLPLWRQPYRGCEPVGLEELAAFAAQLYGDVDPFTDGGTSGPFRWDTIGGQHRVSLDLPFVDRSDVDLARHADELVITVGSHRRLMTLPSALRQARVTQAQIDDGTLTVWFAPDASEEVS